MVRAGKRLFLAVAAALLACGAAGSGAHDLAVAAAAAAKGGDFEKSASLFRSAAQAAPKGGEFARGCLERAAESLYRLGRHPEAATAFLELAEPARDEAAPADGEFRARMLLFAGDAFERAGDARRAGECFAAAVESDVYAPAGAEAALRQGAMLERLGKFEDAERVYSRVAGSRGAPAAADPDGGDAVLGRALLGRVRALCCAGSFGQAEEALPNAIAAGGDPDGEAAYLAILCRQGLGRGDEAREAAERFLAEQSNPTDGAAPASAKRFAPDILYWLASCRYSRGAFAAAQESFVRFATIYPDRPGAPGAMLLAAAAAFRDGRFAETSPLVVALVKAYPDAAEVPRARLLQAKALANVARFEDAVLVCDDLLERFPDSGCALEAAVLRGDALRAVSGTGDYFREAALSYAVALARGDIGPELYAGDAIGAREALANLAKRDRGAAAAAAAEIFGAEPEMFPAGSVQ